MRVSAGRKYMWYPGLLDLIDYPGTMPQPVTVLKPSDVGLRNRSNRNPIYKYVRGEDGHLYFTTAQRLTTLPK